MSLTGEDNGTPLQYSCLENPMNGGAWWATVHGVAKNRTRLSDFTFTFHFHALEKEMATHSTVLAWRIPETGEPGGLPSLGSHRVGHNWSDLAAAADIFNNQFFKSHITLLTAILMSTISSCTRQDKCLGTRTGSKIDKNHTLQPFLDLSLLFYNYKILNS